MIFSRTRQELIDKLSDMYLGYDRIYSILEGEGLVEIETIGGKLKLTQRGEEELKSEAISPSLPSYIHRSRFWFARRIRQYAEGL
uniref:Uncharacterized protein n=1 Tax=Candidatus Methanophaga sp. ANME-1 ERB7 TaxID=2759913 RepID=A0A7G9Z703_9EURY|nr:hypothetical protein GMDKCDLI_00016 [Methanosarcinales archaeon ANME-1 ERB7]